MESLTEVAPVNKAIVPPVPLPDIDELPLAQLASVSKHTVSLAPAVLGIDTMALPVAWAEALRLTVKLLVEFCSISEPLADEPVPTVTDAPWTARVPVAVRLPLV